MSENFQVVLGCISPDVLLSMSVVTVTDYDGNEKRTTLRRALEGLFSDEEVIIKAQTVLPFSGGNLMDEARAHPDWQE